MKILLVATLSLSGFAFGADPKTQSTTEPQDGQLRRLDSVTWDLKTHTLTWIVQQGTEEDGKFVSTGSQRYQVTPDNAVMAVADETRGLQQDEAALLHRLLDTLSIYCAQSVVWWDRGEENLEPSTREATPNLKPERPAKQGEEETKDKAAPAKPAKALPLGVAEVAAHPQVY
jgi:hypothetical protein